MRSDDVELMTLGVLLRLRRDVKGFVFLPFHYLHVFFFETYLLIIRAPAPPCRTTRGLVEVEAPPAVTVCRTHRRFGETPHFLQFPVFSLNLS